MSNKGENKIVLSWNIKSPIMLEPRDRRRGLGLAENSVERVEEREGNFSIISHFAK